MNESKAPGLSMYHISPRKSTSGEVFAPEPKVTFWRGASLVSCQLGVPKGGRGRSHVWTRGDIHKFSKGSRRRVLRLISTLRRTSVPVFCTLTYPDIFPDDPGLWKKHLDNFFKRLLRKYPSAVIVWRMEAKARKSGENTGMIAPHFHLLAYNVEYFSLLTWLPRAWFEVVKSGDPRHYNAGTRVERVRSVNGVLYYTSKYICKAENLDLPGWGRYWGIVNRRELPGIRGEFEVVEVEAETALTVLRYMRRLGSMCYKKGRYIGRRKVPGWGAKYTLICDAEFWYKTLPKIAGG
jgi:hypothetical protein